MTNELKYFLNKYEAIKTCPNVRKVSELKKSIIITTNGEVKTRFEYTRVFNVKMGGKYARQKKTITVNGAIAL